jgi:hypothetical protein
MEQHCCVVKSSKTLVLLWWFGGISYAETHNQLDKNASLASFSQPGVVCILMLAVIVILN